VTYAPALARDITYVDFETEAIEDKPKYPPAPVGVSILEPGDAQATYLSWGHPTGNNCTKEAAFQRLSKLWQDAYGLRRVLGYYNAKFDLEVARVHFGLDLPPPEQVDDTLVLAVLKDARRLNHQLKPICKDWLGSDVGERDELKAWIIANVPEAKRKKSTWGAYICRAPAELVGRYACADVTLTRDLREYLHDTATAMAVPYLRELRLMRTLLSMEQRGVPVDVDGLHRDIPVYTAALERLDDEIRSYMDLPASASLDGDEFAQRIVTFGREGAGWPRTANGKPSTAAETLDYTLADRDLYGALQYRGILSHSLSTFMNPWCSRSVNGRFFVNWNALKGERGLGAGTGRLSSNPNLQNIITDDNCEKADRERPDDYPALPRLRKYIKVPDGKVYVGRDFSQQEYRVFAHYEDDKLAAAYNADPWMDIHDFVRDLLNSMANVGIVRKDTKTINFGMLYGMGKAKLAVKLKREIDMTSAIIAAYLDAFPGVRDMRKQMDFFDKTNQPIQTLGGRIYYAEEPKIIDGQMRRFGYKLVNLLCQGSSADITKAAMIDYDTSRPSTSILSIHDELGAEVDECDRDDAMHDMKVAMETNEVSAALDVPMLSEGFWGYNLQDLNDLPRGE
jgi:DNA polymerase I-like protein with 3'-5' exonuclease and polymerase domains